MYVSFTYMSLINCQELFSHSTSMNYDTIRYRQASTSNLTLLLFSEFRNKFITQAPELPSRDDTPYLQRQPHRLWRGGKKDARRILP